MWGIAPRHVRALCDNPWDGGRGYTPKEVGDMTLDTIFMLLTDRKMLRLSGRQRVAKMPALQAKIDKDGFAAGRAADGTPIRARIGGKTMAQIVKERAAAVGTPEKETPQQRRARERQERARRRAGKVGQQKSD